MGSLIAELDANPEMQAQFEQMMQELIGAGAAPTDEEAGEHLQEAAKVVPKVEEEEKSEATKSSSSKGASKKSGTAGAGSEDFSSTIRKTMERMQHSDSTASASATSKSDSAANLSEDDLLAQMMQQLGSGAGGEGGGEEDFNKMLLSMMTQLTNKEILYEPMKELDDKFPAWMEKNEGQVEKGEMERYKEQQGLVKEIVGRFERKGYSDENEEDRDYIVERMQKVSLTRVLSLSCAMCGIWVR